MNQINLIVREQKKKGNRRRSRVKVAELEAAAQAEMMLLSFSQALGTSTH